MEILLLKSSTLLKFEADLVSRCSDLIVWVSARAADPHPPAFKKEGISSSHLVLCTPGTGLQEVSITKRPGTHRV